MAISNTLLTLVGLGLLGVALFFAIQTLLKEQCPTVCPPCKGDADCRAGEKCLDGKCTVIEPAKDCKYDPNRYQNCVAFTDKDFKSGVAKPGKKDAVGATITDWSTCSATCGGGTQFRYKGVNIKRDPLGKACEGMCNLNQDKDDCLWERRECNTQACPPKPPTKCGVDNLYNCAYRTCKFTNVASASACNAKLSATKGDYLRYDEFTQECFVEGPTAWKSKTQAEGDAICQGGQNLFTKIPCPGKTRICAPKDCLYKPASGWGECSKPCNGGTQEAPKEVQTNAVDGGKPCVGGQFYQQACNTQLCCPIGSNGKVCSGHTTGTCSTSKSACTVDADCKKGETCQGGCNTDKVVCHIRPNPSSSFASVGEKWCLGKATSLKGTMTGYTYDAKTAKDVMCNVELPSSKNATQTCSNVAKNQSDVAESTPMGSCNCELNWAGEACGKEFVSCIYSRKANDYQSYVPQCGKTKCTFSWLTGLDAKTAPDGSPCQQGGCQVLGPDGKTADDDTELLFCANLGTKNVFGQDIGVQDCINRGGTPSDRPCTGGANTGGLNFNGVYGNYWSVNPHMTYGWQGCGQKCNSKDGKNCASDCGTNCDPANKAPTSQPGDVGWDLVNHYDPSWPNQNLVGPDGLKEPNFDQARGWQNLSVCAKRVASGNNMANKLTIGSQTSNTNLACNLSYKDADDPKSNAIVNPSCVPN